MRRIMSKQTELNQKKKCLNYRLTNVLNTLIIKILLQLIEKTYHHHLLTIYRLVLLKLLVVIFLLQVQLMKRKTLIAPM